MERSECVVFLKLRDNYKTSRGNSYQNVFYGFQQTSNFIEIPFLGGLSTKAQHPSWSWNMVILTAECEAAISKLQESRWIK